MTTLSSVNITPLVAPRPAANVPAATNNPDSTAAASVPASIVTLGQSTPAATDQTYSSRGLLADSAVPLALENSRGDKLTLSMIGNLSSPSTAGRFHGLGAALVAQLSTGRGNYSQSVLSPTGQKPSAAELAVDQKKLHTEADNSISLTIKTASGGTVLLNLSSQDGGLGVQIQVTGGTLSDTESSAIGKLADAFQSAIDGFTATPPKLDLGKLSQFDPSVLSSVDLNAKLKLSETQNQTLSFHADSQKKTVNMSGPAGAVQLSVDTKNPAIQGNAQQQAQALRSYLNQFDSARQRGDGDADLMTLFKDAFSQMNGITSKDLSPTTLKTSSSIPVTDVDRVMLTGLADFSASITQVPVSSNPMRPTELDTFAYTVSQDTSTKGSSQLNHSIKQNQQSHLSASYHQGLYPGSRLALDKTMGSQNYNYYQIDDKASSTASLTYDAGVLSSASLVQSATQTTHVMRYEMGQLKDDKTTPTEASKTQDFLGPLEAALLKQRKEAQSMGVSTSATALALHSQVILQADPGQLGG
ncbi:MAG: L-lactate dehydrogenase [Pseudomonas sp.]|nr:L-lactate dehydrogenase [Pseudomonas sp.]